VITYIAGAALVLVPVAAPRIWSADARRNIPHFDRLYRASQAEPVRGICQAARRSGAAFSQHRFMCDIRTAHQNVACSSSRSRMAASSIHQRHRE
jgi:hypothetical protein